MKNILTKKNIVLLSVVTISIIVTLIMFILINNNVSNLVDKTNRFCMMPMNEFPDIRNELDQTRILSITFIGISNVFLFVSLLISLKVKEKNVGNFIVLGTFVLSLIFVLVILLNSPASDLPMKRNSIGECASNYTNMIKVFYVATTIIVATIFTIIATIKLIKNRNRNTAENNTAIATN